jgi:hypothetical protein
MSGAIPPFPQYAYIAWCSVKAQGQLYLYLETVRAVRLKKKSMETSLSLFEIARGTLRKLSGKCQYSTGELLFAECECSATDKQTGTECLPARRGKP